MNSKTPIFGIPANVLEVVDAYKHHNNANDFSFVQSALFRFTVPGLSGVLPQGKRLTADEISTIRQFLATLPLSKLSEFREAQEKTFQFFQTPANKQCQPRSYLNKFLDWVDEQNWLVTGSLNESGGKQGYRFYLKGKGVMQRKKLTNRPANTLDKFALSFDVEDYFPESSEEEESIKQELARIAGEIQAFEDWMKVRGYKESSRKIRREHAKRFLGWLYRAKQIPLEELSLSSLIPVIRLKYSVGEFDSYDKWIYAKGLAIEKAREVATETVEKLEDYFKWLNNPPSPGTKAMYVEGVISLAKFLYREQTDEDYHGECMDVPVVKRLRVFCKQLDQEKRSSRPAVPYHEKAITWEQTLLALEKLRIEANLTHVDSNLKSGIPQLKKRSMQARANSLMRFLIFAFFVLVPPDRGRTFRELRIGETFKHGSFHGDIFIPKDRMLNPLEARYYIHLLPDDYKTGDAYGEWVGEVPNTQFPDGSYFYDYLNQWLYDEVVSVHRRHKITYKGMRSVLQPEEHNYLFFGPINKKPLNDASQMTSKVRYPIERLTGTPLAPHTLRKIFRTFIKDRLATHAEEESIAFWMKHDLRTANKDYTFQTCRNKLQPGIELANRLNGEVLQRIADHL
ncbi:hypothetical protein [Coleofasciculus sp. FACHB-SPT9]|uniref:hypothetical protein n=1 Tax=Cyanophyceae TaxID=3028117 RepID=UPI00168684BD|nr:hypothetical protein [Coleofasciculus sp. FACHB-SPT9]MBD1893005.1 hypothetical protein [Coleofasciculus sp. FACHB-SPT9]